jgi:hypothetical protein
MHVILMSGPNHLSDQRRGLWAAKKDLALNEAEKILVDRSKNLRINGF